MTRRVVSCVAVALAAMATMRAVRADPPAQPAAVRLTLADCIARAERSFPGVAAQRHRVAAAEAQLDEAWAAPFLSFNITGAAGIAPYARGNPTFSPDAFAQNPFETGYQPFWRINVETGIPLSPWTWWRLGRVRDAARAGVRAAEHEETKVRLELRTNVRRAYFGLQLARDSIYLLDRALGYLDTAEEQLERLRTTDGGAYNVNDRRQLRGSRYEALARRSEAQQKESVARRTLGALTGVGDEVDIVDEPLCPYRVTLHPLARYLTEARLHRPEVAMISAGLAARRAAVDIQWGALLPDFALGLSAAVSDAPSISQQINPFAGGNLNYGFWGAALVARWTFEPLTTWYRVRRAREELLTTEAQERMALGGIALEVAEVHSRAVDAQERERLWGEAEREMYEWFTAVFTEYQAGAGEASGIIAPLRQYLQARAAHLQAAHDLDVALAQLAQATGRADMSGAPDPECARPSLPAPAPDDAGGALDEEVAALLNATTDEDGGADASGADLDAAVASDVASGGARDVVGDTRPAALRGPRPVNAAPRPTRPTPSAR